MGVEEESGEYYLSVPVAHGAASYEEYYRIDQEAFERYRADPSTAEAFLERCRNREADDLLFLKPGPYRGAPDF